MHRVTGIHTNAPEGLAVSTRISGRAAFLTIITAAGVTIVAGTAIMQTNQRASARSEVASVSRAELVAAVNAAGITPASVEAAGLTHEQTAAAVTAVYAELGGDASGHAEATAALAASRRVLEDAARRVRQGRASASEYQAALAAHASAQASGDAKLGALQASVRAAIGSSSAAQLEAARDAEQLGLPAAYAPAASSEAEAIVIRAALAAQREAEANAAPVPAAAASALAQAQQDPAVAAALTREGTMTDAVQNTITALAGE